MPKNMGVDSKTKGSKQLDGDEINPHLIERFGQRNAFQKPDSASLTDHQLATSAVFIRDCVKAAEVSGDISHWTGLPEVPLASEVWDEGRQQHDNPVELDCNIIVGPYSSVGNYLERHYRLLREDALSPLRDVISEIQIRPHMLERDSQNDAFIYERAYITGYTFASSGLAARLNFSLKRVGKQINWEQSKRLRTGTILALSPAKDGFRSICRIAVVAARPLKGLRENPPSIDIFFDQPEIDPQEEWVMVESRQGFYEGHRHVMRSLQMMARKTFPLAEHIISLERNIGSPLYVQKQPFRDLSSIFPDAVPEVTNLDILKDLPDLHCTLDKSQLRALQRIMTKRLSLLEGPPGTGKTHVSVMALQLLLENMTDQDSPILVAAHTNHALDQLLRHVAHFEPDFIRLGGMSTDADIIKPRTLYEVKQSVSWKDPPGSLRGRAFAELKRLTKDMTAMFSPLTSGEDLLTASILEQYNLITHEQHQSLVRGAKEWFSAEASENDVLAVWLGDERVEFRLPIASEDYEIECEEPDLEFEQLREIEAESNMIDDEDREALHGNRIDFNEKWTGKESSVSEATVCAELKKPDLFRIPHEYRGCVYRHLQQRLKTAIRDRIVHKAKRYAAVCQEVKIGRWARDSTVLGGTRIIGATLSGVAKYRCLLNSLNPKIVLIEEAAETLESYTSVVCFESLEHLILVGDHLQLRGRCHVQDLEGEPFFLDVSMFERLVRNHVEFSQLEWQRRMLPEIRRALIPIYPWLKDHPSVSDRSSIPGMGKVNNFFFSHRGRETNDQLMSKINYDEAELIVNFYHYLHQNGIGWEDMTVLTFYNGQRKLILRMLRDHPGMALQRFKVVTVDSYQGEENEVVLLSLVRSNMTRNIGFLQNENRICVAISRAKRGFYMFGDGINLCKSSMLWWEVIQIMAKNPRRVGFHFPLTCEKHKNATFIQDAEGIKILDGGCTLPCGQQLPCGHSCGLKCHPYSHEEVECPQRCTRESNSGCGSVIVGKRKLTRPNDSVEAIAGFSTKHNKNGLLRRTDPHVGRPSLNTSRRTSDICGQSFNNREVRPIAVRFKQSFRSHAGGDGIQPDEDTVEAASQHVTIARLKQLDEENAAALFGPAAEEGLVDKSGEMKLVQPKDDGKGGSRDIWAGTYEPPKRELAVVGKEEEINLIDL